MQCPQQLHSVGLWRLKGFLSVRDTQGASLGQLRWGSEWVRRALKQCIQNMASSQSEASCPRAQTPPELCLSGSFPYATSRPSGPPIRPTPHGAGVFGAALPAHRLLRPARGAAPGCLCTSGPQQFRRLDFPEHLLLPESTRRGNGENRRAPEFMSGADIKAPGLRRCPRCEGPADRSSHWGMSLPGSYRGLNMCNAFTTWKENEPVNLLLRTKGGKAGLKKSSPGHHPFLFLLLPGYPPSRRTGAPGEALSPEDAGRTVLRALPRRLRPRAAARFSAWVHSQITSSPSSWSPPKLPETPVCVLQGELRKRPLGVSMSKLVFLCPLLQPW